MTATEVRKLRVQENAICTVAMLSIPPKILKAMGWTGGEYLQMDANGKTLTVRALRAS